MSKPRHLIYRTACVAVAAACSASICVAYAHAGAGPSTAPQQAPHFGPRDMEFGLAAAAVVAVSTTLDRGVWEEAPENDAPLARRFSHGISRLGDPVSLAPIFLLTFAAGHALGHPAFSRADGRIFASALMAGLAADGIKLVVGRARPGQSPGDADRLRPFSGDSAFPSGHATVAFALASALDAETDERWVPLAAFPAAALVGWSRLRDDKHWLSDVVAGAAFGAWAGRKADGLLRQHAGGALRLGPLLLPESCGGAMGLSASF